SAAIGQGETDLAVLASGGWGSEFVRHCEVEYKRARWAEGAPADFDRRLAAARVHWSMLFLGDDPESGPPDEDLGFLEELRAASEQLGFIVHVVYSEQTN